jgi:hypothetical protein
VIACCASRCITARELGPGHLASRAILGALAAAHVATVDDWISVDRYLPMEAGAKADLVIRAPVFLVRAYAKALARLGAVVRVKPAARKRRTSPPPRVLHFGNSFVVADGFEATLGARKLEKNQMQRTVPAQGKPRLR